MERMVREKMSRKSGDSNDTRATKLKAMGAMSRLREGTEKRTWREAKISRPTDVDAQFINPGDHNIPTIV